MPESFYHIYNRGVNRRNIFLDDKDYVVFLSLLKRYLSARISKKESGVAYKTLHQDVELLAYCLMPNHFHLFIYQHSPDAMFELLKPVSIAYAMYFNRRYLRVGPLFQQRYRAIRIVDNGHLLHISRYIHLNPQNFNQWQWSSLPYYTGHKHADWVRPDRIVALFSGDYQSFMNDYVDRRNELKIIENILA